LDKEKIKTGSQIFNRHSQRARCSSKGPSAELPQHLQRDIGHKTLMGKVELSQQEAKDLKQLAKKGVAADSTIRDLRRDLKSTRRDAQIWKRRHEELKEQTKDFLAAVKRASERVRSIYLKDSLC